MSIKIGLVGTEIRNKLWQLFHSDKNGKGWGEVVYEKGEVRGE